MCNCIFNNLGNHIYCENELVSGQLLKIIQGNVKGNEIVIETHMLHLGNFNQLHRFFLVIGLGV